MSRLAFRVFNPLENREVKTRFVIRLAAYFLLFQLLFFSVSFLTWLVYQKTTVNEERQAAKEVFDIIKARAQFEFWVLANDSLTLRRTIETLEDQGLGLNKIAETLTQDLMFLVSYKEFYDQIRILDAGGVEILKIEVGEDGTPFEVPKENLEDKSYMGYMQEAFQLPANKFMLTAMIPNIKNHRVKIPIRPHVRAITPINDPDTDEVLGYVVINLEVKPLLEEIERYLTFTNMSVHIVADDGLWIRSPDKNGEWAPFLGKDETFGKTYPKVWQTITSGTVPGDDLDGVYLTVTEVPILPVLPRLETGQEDKIMGEESQTFVRSFFLLGIYQPPTILEFLMGRPKEEIWFYIVFTIFSFFVAIFVARQVFYRESALKELERSNADLEQFAYVASHDLKAPLRAIDNLSQWIEEDLEGVLEGETKKNMKLLRGRVRRLEGLLDDILLYSRAGRNLEDPAPVDVGAIVKGVVDLNQIPKEFQVKIKTELPTLYAPRGAVKQVFGNLITNALKHHDRKKGAISITCKDLGKFWEFEISDNGPGIPPEYHDRVFQMFQTLKGRDKAEGSGMGLAIIQRIIHSQGGEIKVLSEKGKRGTAFVFTWPKLKTNRPTGGKNEKTK